MKYVLGFLFSPDMERVWLIEKRKRASSPDSDWQAGLKNGVGGKIEPTDASIKDAMSREFREEARTDIHPDLWKHVGTLRNDMADLAVYVFAQRAVSWEVYSSVEPMTEEPLCNVFLPHLEYGECIENLKWLIPLCFQSLQENYKPAIDIIGAIE